MSTSHDVIVIGAGPGGYVAAIRAAQLGLDAVCIDASRDGAGAPAPGGVCTNVGCIPSKALLQSTELYAHARHGFSEHGLLVDGIRADVRAMQARKQKIVAQSNRGILHLFKKNGVRFVNGRATIQEGGKSGWRIVVDGDEQVTLSARNVIIATGSRPRALPGAPFDETRILSNAGALRMDVVPRRLGIIGAGAIGLEMASIWRRLGAEVSILEALPEFLPAADEDVAQEALKLFTKQGLKIETGVQVGEVVSGRLGVTVSYTDSEGRARTQGFDQLIVSIGREPNTDGLNCEGIGLKKDSRGGIEVDERNSTNLPGLWAVGDVVRGPMLAHKAEEEGVAVAERIAGEDNRVSLETVPFVIYTNPEIAWVGVNAAQAQAAGRAVAVGRFPFIANGRARAMGETSGFAKIVADASDDTVLGVHVLGPMAGELVAIGTLAVEKKLKANDLARLCNAHPTLGEALREAARDVRKRAINF